MASKSKPETKSETKAAAPTKSVAVGSSNPYSFASFTAFVNNNFALILIGGLLFIGGFFAGSLWTENQLLRSGSKPTAAAVPAAPTQPTAPTDAPEKVPAVSDSDHIRGNKNAKVVLVEYSDYECPFCGRFHPTMQQAKEEYGDDVAWVYRHYPLSFHPNAQKSAEGAECVSKLAGEDAFWKYSDFLFDVNIKDGKLSPQAIQDAATEAGVNLTQFNTCLDSNEMAAKVTEHQTGGVTAGINGTPGTVVVTKDGGQEIISGAVPFAQVQASVDKYL